jgi:DNA-binding response OmpR family regulator
MSQRVLVVNDTQEILDLFNEILKEMGYEAVLSGFPMREISDVEEIAPDLIILDLIFGGEKTGWQMLQMLKMKRSTASIPVIVCTAALQAVREQEGYLMSQGVHVVYKPFDLEHLMEIIKQTVESRRNIASVVEQEEKWRRLTD